MGIRITRLTEKYPHPRESLEYQALKDFMDAIDNDRNFTFFGGRTPGDVMRACEVWLWMQEGETPWENTAIAYGHIQRDEGNEHKRDICRLGVCVHPSFQGNGYGPLIVAHLLREAEAMRMRKIVATVFADNRAMLHIFREQFGFVQEGCFQDEEVWDGERRSVISLAKFLPQTESVAAVSTAMSAPIFYSLGGPNGQ